MLGAIVGFLTSVCLYGFLLLAGLWLWFHWSHRELLRAAAKIPLTSPTIPILGHGHLTLTGLEDMCRKLLEMSVGAMDRGIKTACFWCGPFPLICIQDIDDIQTLLNGLNTSDKADEYDYFISGMDSGVGPFRKNILSAKGTRWKVTRKHLNPMFHPRNVEQFMPVFNANSREFMDRLAHHVGRGPFNVMEYSMDVGLKTICNLIFGPSVTIDVNTEAFRGLMIVMEMIPGLFIDRLLRPWLRPDILFRIIHRKKINQLSTLWRNFTETPLKVTREHQKQKKPRENIFNMNEINETPFTEEDQEPVNFFDVYTILQQNHPELKEADLRCDMITLYCTGTDTIGTATASCLLALAQYQDIQERLYQEISSVVGPDDDVTLEDLSRMPYLEMVVKETLRLFLIVPYTLRKTTKEVVLSQHTIPTGSTLIINLAAIHMNPSIYPDPTKFDPERFAPENSAGKEKFAFVPFSGGPRNCIAKTYAMNLIRIMVVHVLRKYRLSTTQDIHNLKKKLIVTLVSAEGYNISLESRNPNKLLVESD